MKPRRYNIMKYDTLICDLDGTLTNTIGDLTEAVNVALKQYGFLLRNEDEITRFAGNGNRTLIKRSAPENTSEEIREEMYATFCEYYEAHSMVKTKPYEGITDVLNELKRMNVKMAVVTNKNESIAFDVVKHYFGDLFDAVIGQIDGVPLKPAPDGVFRAIEKLGADKSKCVYLGDSEVDCMTAHNASLPIIGVLWGFRDRAIHEKYGSEYIIEKPSQIIDIIK
ncbi:MAG: HAD family hydrolase [Clostridia bacterium]|nr:HAD family hydrolase [Clostridia bacterium]